MSTEMPQQVAEVYDVLSRHLSGLYAKWNVFMQLYSDSEERIALLRDTAPYFFGMVEDVLLDDFVLSIGRLTDSPGEIGKNSDHRNLSLDRLVQILSDLDEVALKNDVTNMLVEVKELSSLIRSHRDRRVAHMDLRTALNNHPETLPSIDGIAFVDTLRIIGELLNRVSAHYGRPPVAYSLVPIGGNGDDLVFHLKLALEYLNRRHADPRRFQD